MATYQKGSHQDETTKIPDTNAAKMKQQTDGQQTKAAGKKSPEKKSKTGNIAKASKKISRSTSNVGKHVKNTSSNFLTAALVKSLLAGIPNPKNNCWFNSVMVAMLNTYGSFRVFETPDEDTVAFMQIFGNLISSMDICREGSSLTSTDLSEMLMENFRNTKFCIGRHEDASEFFIDAAMWVDQNKNSVDCPHIYGISTKTFLTCLQCGMSKVTGEVESKCLSVQLESTVNTISVADLLVGYFDDEVIHDHACDECGEKYAALGRKVSNTPDVIAVNLKRYQGEKHTAKMRTSVETNLQLDLSEQMEKKDKCHYKLRAVICHKGLSLQSGHYTCCLYDDDIVHEIGNVVVTNNVSDQVCLDSYIYLYENEETIKVGINFWRPLLLVLLTLNTLAQKKSILSRSLNQIWDSINPTTDILCCKRLMNILACQLARSVRFANIDIDGVAMINKLLELMCLSKQQYTCMEKVEIATCNICGEQRKAITTSNHVICEDLSIASLKDAIKNSSSGKYECCEEIIPSKYVTCIPVHFPPMLITLCRSEYITDATMKVVSLCPGNSAPSYKSEKYELQLTLSGNEATIVKNNTYYTVSQESELHLQGGPIMHGNGMAILVSKDVIGHSIVIKNNRYQTTVANIETAILDQVRLEMDICLENLLYDTFSADNLQHVRNCLNGGGLSEKFIQFYCRSMGYYLNICICAIRFDSLSSFMGSPYNSILQRFTTDYEIMK